MFTVLYYLHANVCEIFLHIDIRDPGPRSQPSQRTVGVLLRGQNLMITSFLLTFLNLKHSATIFMCFALFLFSVYANFTSHEGKKENIEFNIPSHISGHRHSPLKSLTTFTALSTDFNSLAMYIDCQRLRIENIALPLRSLLRANQTLVSVKINRL